ncbi:MAG: thioredoxin family protein [Chitinispirillaceae bacterium]
MKFKTAALFSSFLIFSLVRCLDPVITMDEPDGIEYDNALTLDSTNIDSLALDSGKVALIEFYSDICETCKAMSWVTDSLARVRGDSVCVGVINVDNDTTLWKRYQVGSVPTFILFVNGEKKASRSYYLPDSNALDTLSLLIDKAFEGEFDSDTSETGGNDTDSVLLLDEDTFDSAIDVPGRITLVDFFSPTCLACRHMDSTVNNLSVRYEGEALIAKVNVNEQISLGSRYSIRTVPTFIFFQSGTEVKRIRGVVAENSLSSILDSLILVEGGGVPVD